MSLTRQSVDRINALLAKDTSIMEPRPFFSKVFFVPVFSRTASSIAKALSSALPLGLVALLPHSIAQALKSPAIMFWVVVIASFTSSSSIFSYSSSGILGGI